MRYRIGVAVTFLLASAFALQGQVNMYKIQLNPSGAMVSLEEPKLENKKYVFRAWPDGGQTHLKQGLVRNITQLTGGRRDTIYQIELVPLGTITARDIPTLKGNIYLFHGWRDGNLMSLRQADMRTVTVLTGDEAFWVEQGLMGETKVSSLSMQGMNKVVEIGTPSSQASSTQAGARNLNTLATNGYSRISGAPAGNEGQPGVSNAWGPANATVNSPGGFPRMPAATDGHEPPH